ncbi:hypothetical protein ACFQX7_04185 [Luedemannella flava]
MIRRRVFQEVAEHNAGAALTLRPAATCSPASCRGWRSPTGRASTAGSSWSGATCARTGFIMSPDDQYLCVVPEQSSDLTDKGLFLPFEGTGCWP